MIRYFILCFFIINTLFANSQSDTISLTINAQNTIYLKAVLNETDTLNLNFDTGTTDLVLTEDVLAHKIKSTLTLFDSSYNLVIGKTNYNCPIYPAQLTGHDTDGRFGWNLFENQIVELNYTEGIFVIHSSFPDFKRSSYSNLRLHHKLGLIWVECSIIQNEKINKALFLFDTGYQRTIMLDNDLLAEHQFPTDQMKVIKKVIMRGAQGNEIPVITANLQQLEIDHFMFPNIPAQLLTANKPIPQHNTHILGNEILKRFDLIFDFQNDVLYLKPNHFSNDGYIDQKNKG